MYVCLCKLSWLRCALLFVTLWTVACWLLCPWDSPGQNTEEAHLVPLNISSQPREWTQISFIAGWFFNNWAKWEAQIHVYVKLNHFAGHLKHNMVNQIYSNEKKIKRIHQHVKQLAQKTNWKMQKDSQTYSQRKIHREQGMKGKWWFKSLHVPMGEDSEYKGDYTVGGMPWVWVVRAMYWTHKSWGLTQGR